MLIRAAAVATAESVVEHAERQRLQDHRVGERPLDGEDGGAGEVQFTLAVTRIDPVNR